MKPILWRLSSRFAGVFKNETQPTVKTFVFSYLLKIRCFLLHFGNEKVQLFPKRCDHHECQRFDIGEMKLDRKIETKNCKLKNM